MRGQSPENVPREKILWCRCQVRQEEPEVPGTGEGKAKKDENEVHNESAEHEAKRTG